MEAARTLGRDGAETLSAYEALAPFYDSFTAGYRHDVYLAELERELRRAGLAGRDVLDAACGTGHSSIPLVELGYEVTGCDLSPAMAAIARRRLAGRAHVDVADVRALPYRQRFDLVTCLDDALNYLVAPADLPAAMRSFERALRPGGLLAFDVNTARTYREAFAATLEIDQAGVRFRWRGDARPFVSGSLHSATLEALPADGAAVITRHVQRHHSRSAIRRACLRAGLEPLSAWGLADDATLVTPADEAAHAKLVYLARKPPNALSERR